MICVFTVSDHYVATVTWASEDRLVIQWLKRLQNHLIFQTYKHEADAWTPEMVKLQFCFISTGKKLSQTEAPI